MKKNKHIKNVKQLGASSLGLFLITGLTGCDSDNNKCKDMSMLPKKQLEECRSHHGFIPIFANGTSYPTSTSSGYFSTGSKTGSSSSRGSSSTSFSSGG